ncbi:tRNA pseudouridine(55) synthase [Entamoeba marina]
MTLLSTLLDLYCSGKLCIYCVARFSYHIGEEFYQQGQDVITQKLFNEDKRTLVNGSTDSCGVCGGMSHYLQTPHVIDDIKTALTQSRHQYDGQFSISISFPNSIFVREAALVHHIKQSMTLTHFQPIRIKDTLRFILLGNYKEWNYISDAPLRLLIDFSHHQLRVEDQESVSIVSGCKRKRSGSLTATNATQLIEKMNLEEFQKHFTVPPQPLDGPLSHRFHFERDYTYVGGRYRKYSRQLSQSQWVIEGKLLHEHSVTQVIGEILKKYYDCDEYFLLSSGREDVDVRMLGNGRPFIMQLKNSRNVDLSEEKMAEVQEQINQSPALQVMHLQQVTAKDLEIIKNGETSKRKEYLALIWAENMKELEVKDLRIMQKTPIRVLHRRSLLTRERIIYSLKLTKLDDHFGLLSLQTEAGTYIKEFVHGDLGRTQPNIQQLLNCDADILSLDVMGVLLDFPPQCRPEPVRQLNFDLPPFVTLTEEQQKKVY